MEEEHSNTTTIIQKPVGGTYGSFRQPKYRSVAFGTWKVGEARSFSERHRRKRIDGGVMNESWYAMSMDSSGGHFDEDKGMVANDTSLASCISASSSTQANDSFQDACLGGGQMKDFSSTSRQQPSNLSENNNALSRSCEEEDETLNSLTIASTTSSDNRTPPQRPQNLIGDSMGPSTAHYNPDCYSSTEYLEYCMRKGEGIVSDNLPIGRSLMVNRSMDNLCSARTSGYGTCSSTTEPQPHDSYTMSLGRHNNLVRKQQKPLMTPSGAGDNPNTFILTQPNLSQHKRARSFDNATRFAVIQTPMASKPSTFGAKGQENGQEAKKTRFQATKNFLKKLYNNSTTLPKKLRGSKNAQKPADEHFKAAISPFYEIRYPDPEERPFLPYNIQYQIESDDEGAELDTDILDETSASSPSPGTVNTSLNSTTSQKTSDDGIFSSSEDKSVASSSEISGRSSSSAQQNKIVTEKFTSWNDLFSHLKKEIVEMRARDAQILAHLKTVEEQLNFVKGIDRSRSEFTDLNSFLRMQIQQQSKRTYI